MRGSKVKIGAMALAMAMIMDGCGEAPIALTESEQAVIVNYAAHIVSKYNKRQPDGLSYVPQEEYDTEEEQLEQPVDTETESEAASEQTDNQGAQETSSEDISAPEPEYVSLAQALAITDLDVAYTGCEVNAAYVQADYYAMDATTGNTFLIVHVQLTNSGSSPVDCNLLGMQPSIRATVNGDVTSTALTTILLNDLGTYQSTIEAGASADTVLLFEYPADRLSEVSQLELSIRANGTTSEVKLQ